ncbi:hypothetical protein [Escherichia coli]|uniref:hypothetical protein n=1 Tax=Escherichia coli TaxID=562 RepID=UPI000B2E12CF|nr:hypothetical protein [Escherichia coli]
MKVFLFKSERIQEKTGADDEKNITGVAITGMFVQGVWQNQISKSGMRLKIM